MIAEAKARAPWWRRLAALPYSPLTYCSVCKLPQEHRGYRAHMVCAGTGVVGCVHLLVSVA